MSTGSQVTVSALTLRKHLSCASSAVEGIALTVPPKQHKDPLLFCSNNIFFSLHKCKFLRAKSLTSIQFPRLGNPTTALYCNQAGKNLAAHQDKTEHFLLSLIEHLKKKYLSGTKSFPLSGWEVPTLAMFNNKNFNCFISVSPDFLFQDILSIN